MDIDQLRYFTVIAKHQSLTKAQDELHIAQPALSTSLNRLEKQLGVPLFDRYKGRLYLNRFGKIFLQYADDICKAFNEAESALAKEQERIKKHLFIAVLDWGFFPGLIPDFSNTHPDIVVNAIPVSIAGASPDEYLVKYDIVITPFPMTFSNAVCVPLLKDELLLAVPSCHPLYGRESVSLEDLNGQHLLLLGMQMHFGSFVQTLLDQNGIHPSHMEGCVAENLVVLLKMRKAVSLVVPGIRRRMDRCDSVRFLPLDPGIFRTSGIAFSEQQRLSPAASEFLRFAMDYCRQQPNSV